MNRINLTLALVIFLFSSCRNKHRDQPVVIHDTVYIKNDTKQYDADLENETLKDLATKEFSRYRSRIENKEVVVDSFYVHVGDFTYDGEDDALITYNLVSKGGNANVDERIVFFKGKEEGGGLEFIKDYSPGYEFIFNEIKNNKIFIIKTEYGPNDPHCCPSIKTGRLLKLDGKKVLDLEDVDKD